MRHWLRAGENHWKRYVLKPKTSTTYAIRRHYVADIAIYMIFVDNRPIGQKYNLTAAKSFVARHLTTGYEQES